jgi:hypothetical protein
MLARLAAAGLALALVSSPALAQDRVQVGLLTCKIAGGMGWILGSSRSLECMFDPSAAGAPNETYSGNITKFGIDIGVTKDTDAAWGVFALKSPATAGALAGHYGGVTASATVGVGLGANVLVGGFNNSFALQPISVQAQTGADISAGIAELELKFTR